MPGRCGETQAQPLVATTRRSLQIILLAVVIAPALVLAMAGRLSWQEAWREAERELERTAEAVAAYGRGAIESYRVAAQLLNQMLLGLTDEQIRFRELELHEQARTVSNGCFRYRQRVYWTATVACCSAASPIPWPARVAMTGSG
jgi:hypothetical protein